MLRIQHTHHALEHLILITVALNNLAHASRVQKHYLNHTVATHERDVTPLQISVHLVVSHTSPRGLLHQRRDAFALLGGR
jgi:hypothetical protein